MPRGIRQVMYRRLRLRNAPVGSMTSRRTDAILMRATWGRGKLAIYAKFRGNFSFLSRSFPHALCVTSPLRRSVSNSPAATALQEFVVCRLLLATLAESQF
ncbi:hypothetical protein AAHA92_01812 [Salvia divinorum]|uniref:Uncharacterized protein n=1 Tax=Salvia divinorum TaxID=28513 RepID=A0ABD1IED7_SALDI